MGWKIYFWIYLVLTLIGLVAYSSKLQNFNLVDWISLILSLALLVGSFAYAFHKVILSTDIWKGTFWIAIIYWVLQTIQTFVPIRILSFMSGNIASSTTEMLIGLVMSLPAFYAVYKLSNNEFVK